jgi:hypothetical protein
LDEHLEIRPLRDPGGFFVSGARLDPDLGGVAASVRCGGSEKAPQDGTCPP